MTAYIDYCVDVRALWQSYDNSFQRTPALTHLCWWKVALLFQQELLFIFINLGSSWAITGSNFVQHPCLRAIPYLLLCFLLEDNVLFALHSKSHFLITSIILSSWHLMSASATSTHDLWLCAKHTTKQKWLHYYVRFLHCIGYGNPSISILQLYNVIFTILNYVNFINLQVTH